MAEDTTFDLANSTIYVTASRSELVFQSSMALIPGMTFLDCFETNCSKGEWIVGAAGAMPGLGELRGLETAGKDAEEMVTLYRGVDAAHPGFANALEGAAIPRAATQVCWSTSSAIPIANSLRGRATIRPPRALRLKKAALVWSYPTRSREARL